MKHRDALEKLFNQINSVILRRQHPITGLLPASTSVNSHGNYTDAWVRDNVYSIMCVWCLSLAYRRYGEKEKQDMLEQATIKLMRGLLNSMMRQATKVESFKHSLDHRDALHAKYDTATGLEVVADDAWGHLQIDATSLYLLMLAQMSASGLRIVCTLDEVDFVQNLVYYIASAYRTPDFGIWERGNKINNGKTEINASSVGMAKAALQALDGLNLFGKDATPRATVHSVPDAISLARNTLAALLPRESLSKETDSALLSIIGFPAFAVGDKTLAGKTRDDILAKLGGNYGCKRFLWDGHQTALEESSRLYYEHSELANFEHVESEWPLFFTYLYIHALFDGNRSTAEHYRQKIESLMVEVDGVGLIPELYYVPDEHVEQEKSNPRSQLRVPNENVPLVWSQSLYWLGLMLDEGWVSRDDLDPLKMRRRSRNAVSTQIALVVLAENDTVKSHLAEYGVIAETIPDIAPIRVITAPNLVDTYTQIGANSALRLTGRPRRRLQSLATSQTYQINGRQCLCLSWIQSEHNDYRGFDPQLMARNIEREISHIRAHWLNQEVAVFTWMIDEHFCQALNVETLYEVLRDMQLRTTSEHVGYASAKLAIRASRINRLVVPQFSPLPFSGSSPQKEDTYQHLDKVRLLDSRLHDLLECMEIETEETCYNTLDVFLNQYGVGVRFGQGEQIAECMDVLQYIYSQALIHGRWLMARFCYSLMDQYPIDLADGMTVLAARHLSVVIGKSKAAAIAIDAPMQNSEIAECINKLYHNRVERTVVQEMLANIGTIMRTEPRLFDGLRSIQIQNLLMLCAYANEEATEQEILMSVGQLSPAELFDQMHAILDRQHRLFQQGLSAGFFPDQDHPLALRASSAVDTDWFEWRVARGAITRLDDAFLSAIWRSLGHARLLIFGDRGNQEHVLDCDFVRSSMTPGEVSFAHHVDHLTQQLHPTYYKSAVLETLYVFTEFCESYPESRFEAPIIFAEVLERAAKSYIWDAGAPQLGKRDLDSLLEQPPNTLRRYTLQVFEDIATVLTAGQQSVTEY